MHIKSLPIGGVVYTPNRKEKRIDDIDNHNTNLPHSFGRQEVKTSYPKREKKEERKGEHIAKHKQFANKSQRASYICM